MSYHKLKLSSTTQQSKPLVLAERVLIWTLRVRSGDAPVGPELRGEGLREAAQRPSLDGELRRHRPLLPAALPPRPTASPSCPAQTPAIQSRPVQPTHPHAKPPSRSTAHEAQGPSRLSPPCCHSPDPAGASGLRGLTSNRSERGRHLLWQLPPGCILTSPTRRLCKGLS